jgi:hypothetical protein
LALGLQRAKLSGVRGLILALLLTACSERGTATNPAQETVDERKHAAEAAAQPPSSPAAHPFSVSEKTSLYDFEYGWPAEAAAVPELDARFRKEMGEAKAELISVAKEDRSERTVRGYTTSPHATLFGYETAGQSERLLSLVSTVYRFTGGAHGFNGSNALLWDRKLARELSLQDLLASGQSWTGAIRQPFCVLLDRERQERREEPVNRDDLFGNCPELKDVTVAPADTDKNGRFDHIAITADQYVAGPYAEGPYDISLPITAKMIERLKPEYASSFEPRPPVQ